MWVGVHFFVFFGCVVLLPVSWEARLGRRVSDCVVASAAVLLAASWEARLGHRVSDCVVASAVWSGWVSVKMLFFFGCVARLPAAWDARLGHRVSDCIVASRVRGWVGGC